jgi:hypothetical protein
VVCDEVVGWPLAPWTVKRTWAPGKGAPNWSRTWATRSRVPPTVPAPCFGVRWSAAATGACQVAVTALEVSAPVVAVTVEVPVTAEPNVKTAPPEASVVADPDEGPRRRSPPP